MKMKKCNYYEIERYSYRSWKQCDTICIIHAEIVKVKWYLRFGNSTDLYQPKEDLSIVYRDQISNLLYCLLVKFNNYVYVLLETCAIVFIEKYNSIYNW